MRMLIRVRGGRREGGWIVELPDLHRVYLRLLYRLNGKSNFNDLMFRMLIRTGGGGGREDGLSNPPDHFTEFASNCLKLKRKGREALCPTKMYEF